MYQNNVGVLFCLVYSREDLSIQVTKPKAIKEKIDIFDHRQLLKHLNTTKKSSKQNQKANGKKGNR